MDKDILLNQTAPVESERELPHGELIDLRMRVVNGEEVSDEEIRAAIQTLRKNSQYFSERQVASKAPKRKAIKKAPDPKAGEELLKGLF